MTETKRMLDPDPRVLDFTTEYELGQDNIRPFGLDIHNPVFVISGVVIVAFVLLALANQEASAAFFGWLRPFLTSTFDWFLMLSVNIMAPYLGHKAALSMLGSADGETAYTKTDFPTRFWHFGPPWFLPFADAKFRMLDLRDDLQRTG